MDTDQRCYTSAKSRKVSPYFLLPGRLTSILQDLRNRIPPETDLLLPVTQEAAHNAYSWLIATPAIWNNTLRIFLQVPLKTPFNSFYLYKILMVPERIPAEKVPGRLSVMMGVETPFIAVMANRQKHMLITEIDLMGCDGGPIRLCNIPNMVRDRSCSMSLLAGDQKAVERQCEKHIVVNPKPIAYRLGDAGTWLYGVPRELRLTVNCPITKNVTVFI